MILCVLCVLAINKWSQSFAMMHTCLSNPLESELNLFPRHDLQMTLPWGSLSSLKLDCRSQSDDGPIMWVRPGEQMVPTADVVKSPFKRRRYHRDAAPTPRGVPGFLLLRLTPSSSCSPQVNERDQEPPLPPEDQRAQRGSV